MEINGIKLDRPNVEEISFNRNGEVIVFKAQAVLDYSDFDALCPEPKPPEIMRPGGQKSVDLSDKKYLKDVETYANKKYYWMCIKSLEATEGLVWNTIDITKPETWDNFEKELRDSFFTDAEIYKIISAITKAQGLDDVKVKEAMNSFLAGQGQE